MKRSQEAPFIEKNTSNMKQSQEAPLPVDIDTESTIQVSGDTIGNTAYSERFVLKILLKFANLDTLKEDIQGKDFEDDLCTLWDMTAERDVVEFLLKHDILNLFQFAVPVIDSARIMEIILGIIGNMCCEKKVVVSLLNISNFLSLLLEYIKTDDSLVLVQVLRFVNATLYLSKEDDISVLMDIFDKISYSEALYFILENSSHKDLLVNGLENLNTICSYCNIEKYRLKFFKQFAVPNSVEAVSTAVTEIVNHKNNCEKDELERILVISLQISLNLIGFDKSIEMLNNVTNSTANMIEIIMNYYEIKITENKEIDSDLVDVIESSITIVNTLKLFESCDPNKFTLNSYRIWKALHVACRNDQNGENGFEDDDKDASSIAKEIIVPVSNFISYYLEKCTEDNMVKVLDHIGSHFKDLLSCVNIKELQSTVTLRTSNYISTKSNHVDN